MIIRSLGDVIGGERDVDWGNGRSRRLLLARDGMGYALTDTTVKAGSESRLHYKEHLEACYCVEGEGEVEVGGVVYPIRAGTVYALDRNEPHVLRARTDMRFICVFNPPLAGAERHDLSAEGFSSYASQPPAGEPPAAAPGADPLDDIQLDDVGALEIKAFA
ncbi:MAG TPA: ectoine synthase [Kofleriaceae bacterium]|nr:ectoine synthase [Kofleriaceae bacterium]